MIARPFRPALPGLCPFIVLKLCQAPGNIVANCIRPDATLQGLFRAGRKAVYGCKSVIRLERIWIPIKFFVCYPGAPGGLMRSFFPPYLFPLSPLPSSRCSPGAVMGMGRRSNRTSS